MVAAPEVTENAHAHHITAAVVVEREGRFLMVSERVAGRIVLNQPAGHLEPDETLAEAACREALEETGWHVGLRWLVGLGKLQLDGGELVLRASFAAEPLWHDADLPLDGDIVAVHWLSPDELRRRRDELRSPLTLETVERYMSGHHYPLDLLH